MKRVSLAALLLMASCTFDTSLPEAPQLGRLLGKVDTQGHLPLTGQTVTLSSDDGVRTTATTDDQGAFVFADLKPGLYLVSAALPGFARISSDLLRVRPGQDTDAGTLTPDWLQNTPQEATLVGKVTAGSGGDINGAKVEFLLAGTPVAQLSVAADGAFVQRLPPGTFAVRASHPSFVTATLADVVLAPAAQVDLSMKPLVLEINPATLTGTVQRERDGLTPSPAMGALVTLDTGQTTTVDAAGHFQLTGLPAGQRQVRIALTGWHDAQSSHGATLLPGKTTALDPVTLQLDRGVVLGTVKLADNSPVSGARVALSGTNFAALVSPDPADTSKGGFTLSGVPVGTYSLVAEKEQYSNATATVVVVADAPKDVGTLTLARLQGDFAIDDNDSSNTSGYTRTLSVTLNFTGFPATGVATYRASEDPADAGAFLPYTGRLQPFTLQAGEGVHTVYAQYKDTQGQVSQSFSSAVVLDTVAPTAPAVTFDATGVAGTTRYTNRAQDLPLQILSSDGTGSGLSLMRLAEALDGGAVTSPAETYKQNTTLKRAVVVDGPQSAFVQVLDHAGNPSPVGQASVIVDTQPPTGTISARRGPKATDDGYTNTPLVTLDETFSDGDGGLVLVKLANASAELNTAVYQSATVTTSWFLNGSSDGAKTIYAGFRDVAGNESLASGLPATAAITFDTQAPQPAAASVVGPTVTRSPTVTLALTTNPADLSTLQALTVSDEASFTSASTLAPAPFPGSSQVQFTLSSGDGTRPIYVRFRDKAGNDAVTSASVTLDTVAPVGSFSLTGFLADGTPSSTLTSTNQVTVTFNPGDAVEYRLGDELMTTCPATGYTALVTSVLTSQTLPPSGTMRACLRDAAGNARLLPAQTLALDAAAPSSCALSVKGFKVDGSPAPSGRSAKTAVQVSAGGCTGAEVPREWVLTESSVTCTAPGLPWQPYATDTTFVLVGGDGVHTVRACVRDLTRNAGSAAAVTVDLDTTPPSSASVLLDNGNPYVNFAAYQARGSVFTASAAGTATGATEWSVSLNGTFTTYTAYPSTSPATVTFPGTGLQKVYASFRDDLGNTAPAVSDDITFDVSPPSVTGTTVALVTSAPDPTFVASSSVAAKVSPGVPAGAANVYTVQVATSVTCTASVFSGVPGVPATADLLFVAAGGDGPKRLCVAYDDLAANLSGVLTLDFTVDSTPPTQPSTLTPSTTVNLANGAGFDVVTTGAVTEQNFLRYERSTLAAPSWVSASAVQSTTTFTFAVVSSGAVASTANVLRLRAVDRAGNVSPTTEVVVTTDVVPPAAPVVSQFGVQNFDRRARVFWQAVPDAVNYRVYYGLQMFPLDGAYADEGVSGFVVPRGTLKADLNGLPNGSITYLAVQAVDAAGNVSPVPQVSGDSITNVVAAQPNAVSPSQIGEFTIPGVGEVLKFAVSGDTVLFAGSNLSCNTGSFAPITITVGAIDAQAIVSPVQSGALVLPVVAPPVLWSLSFADSLTRSDCLSTQGFDFLVDGQYLYVLSNTRLRIYRQFSRSQAPSLITTITFSGMSHRMAMKGNFLFVNGAFGTLALDVNKLNDASTATLPALADVVSTITGAGYPTTAGSMVITRNNLLVSASNAFSTWSFNVADAIDQNAGTSWDTGDVASPFNNNFGSAVSGSRAVSGNIFYHVLDSAPSGTLQLRSLATVWAGTASTGNIPPLAATFSMGGDNYIQVYGGEVYSLNKEQPYVSLADMTSALAGQISLPSRMQLVSVADAGVAQRKARAEVSYGPYLLVSDDAANVEIYETATPSTLRAVSRAGSGGTKLLVDGAFLYNAQGGAIDLQSGWPPQEIVPSGTSTLNCSFMDLVRFGDTNVYATTYQGGGGDWLAVADTRNADDRDNATTMAWTPGINQPSVGTGGYNTNLGVAGTQFMALEAYGNYLVAAELRTTGLFLEVFDATPVRNGIGTLAAGNSRGAIQLSASTYITPIVDLTISHGRAFVTYENQSPAFAGQGHPTPGVYAVDFRNLVDDDAATTGFVLQGSLPVAGAREIALRGNTALITRQNTLEAWDVSAAMDENAGSVLSAVAPLGTLVLNPDEPDALKVYGSYAFVINNRLNVDGRLWVIDVSNPAAMRIISSVNEAWPHPGCGPSLRSDVAVVGSRAYASGVGSTTILELE
ncbi:MAG: carboxypeptidase-like regulatory domain-containing protein [Myxococcaceae bacterium]|nr:carboxypeptidase-like regulatory domain-containing protein [Myxococcaceae bacterium]